METIKAQATNSKITSTIDLSDELRGLTKSQKQETLNQVGELLVEQILLATADQTSPVTGSKFKKLSDDYAKIKRDETGSSDANLDLTGSMLNALDFKVKDGKIEIGVYGSDAPKADGHNNFSGKSKLPERQFLPKEGQDFESTIRTMIQDLIDFKKADNADLNISKLETINSEKELYAFLSKELGITGKAAIKNAVLGSNISEILAELDLLDLL